MCFTPKLVFNGFDVPISVPCGRCSGCLRDRIRLWTFRLVAELPYWSKASFVTFTYDDSSYLNLPERYSLCHKHFQKFMKRLRKAYPDDRFAYMMCGEYGGETFRCHYHAILFGLWPDDSIKNSFNGLFTSESLSNLWPYGSVTFGTVSAAACAYVAGYINKKMGTTSSGIYDGLKPPYIAVSQGIGLRYCLDNYDQLRRDMSVVAPDGSVLPLPRYYKQKLELTTDELYDHYLKCIEKNYHPGRYSDDDLFRSRYLQEMKQKKVTADFLRKRYTDRNGIID